MDYALHLLFSGVYRSFAPFFTDFSGIFTEKECMKKFVPFLILGLVFVMLLWKFLPKKETEIFPLQRFSKIPVLAGGRVKPLDSVARTALLSIHGKQNLSISGESWSPIRWLLELLAHPEKADAQKIFLIQNPEVLGILRKTTEEKYFSFSEISPFLDTITAQADSVLAGESQSPFQKSILNLRDRLTLYQGLKNFLQRDALSLTLSRKRERVREREDGFTVFSVVPFLEAKNWESTHHPLIVSWAQLILAARNSDPLKFSETLNVLESFFYTHDPSLMRNCVVETHFNRLELFYLALCLYLLVFLLGLLSWIFWPREFQATAFWLLLLAFLIHSMGLLTRMALQGRPPITNLYSSAIYIGWMSVLLGIFLEKMHKNGFSSIVASLIGFTTLIIAHHLSFSGDTLEMMRAVLDSNFWLSTHVVCVTTGYSSTFVAGFLSILAILKERFQSSRSGETSNLAPMVYGILCFSTLFSFVGTVLGGIWADQSWGRFWGWDPKENGALLIVLWNVIILHSKLAEVIRDRGLFVMAVFGNIVTSWSWFGVNMLGVGLHSYGFMDQAFFWLLGFMLLQGAFMIFGMLPKRKRLPL
jgi:ABC-type transport system involved in cytochrome c biogenesis permease subunit